MFGTNAKFRTPDNMNNIATISTCNPTMKTSCNGGQCVLVGVGTYACRCQPGYTGAYCEDSWVEFDNNIVSLHCNYFFFIDINECQSTFFS